MREAIGQLLPIGIAVALSPFPIVAVVLMLVTEHARANGPAFVLGWVAGLAIVGAVVLAIASPAEASEDGQPATWVGVLKLVLGTLLLLVALRQWRMRPREGEEPPVPKWMGALDGFTAPKSLAVAALLSGLNPKNLLLAVGAAVAIAQTGISGGQQAAAYTVFVFIATVGIAAPVIIYFTLGSRSAAILGQLKGLDVAQQCGHHSGPLPRHWREADRRRHGGVMTRAAAAGTTNPIRIDAARRGLPVRSRVERPLSRAQ